MPSRPDLRDLVTSVREAFADADRDTLLDVLTFVVQEYVVEGPPPMLMHQAEKLADLAHLSFAQLVSTLQTRLEAPELSLFAVDGDQVSVRIGGVMHPLMMARAGAPATVELPRPSAGVHVVETPTLPRPAQARTRKPPPRRPDQPNRKATHHDHIRFETHGPNQCRIRTAIVPNAQCVGESSQRAYTS